MLERVLVSWWLEFVDVPSHHRSFSIQPSQHYRLLQSLKRLRLQELFKIGDLDYDATLASARP